MIETVITLLAEEMPRMIEEAPHEVGHVVMHFIPEILSGIVAVWLHEVRHGISKRIFRILKGH